jgi:hypothetical protein
MLQEQFGAKALLIGKLLVQHDFGTSTYRRR